MSPRLVFVGAPGSGKTTIGKQVAQKLSVDFIDVDNEIEMDEKTTISDIFVKKGEDHFRQLERTKISELLNFKIESELKPDYKYIINGIRSHKFNFRNRNLDGIYKIYDCGKIKWIYNKS